MAEKIAAEMGSERTIRLEIRIRPAEERDVGEILAIENACFSMPHTEQQLHHEVSSETSLILVACDTSAGAVCGFVTMQHVMDEGYIGDVAVKKSCRRKGIADALLKALRKEALKRNLVFVTLEVRESNAPAIALYEKNGYKKISVMKEYYTLPKENAIIMTMYL